MRFDSLLDAIGHTPLVELQRFSPKPGIRIFAKLEGHNPSGSVKDRIALAMVQEAEASGRLTAGHTILEPSSGNTGIALAMVGTIKGYKVTIVLPKSVSPERHNSSSPREIVFSTGELAPTAP
jgi:cysteine synthase B